MARIGKKELPDMGEVPEDWKSTSFLQSKFKIARHDAKGQSAHINFWTSPYHVRIAQELQVKIADLTTLSDVYACALHYGLKWMQDQEGVGEATVHSQLEVWISICQEAEAEEDLMLAMDKLKETVNKKLAHGALEVARRTVARARFAAEQMPEGYYRDRALEFLDREFRELWNAGGIGSTNGKPTPLVAESGDGYGDGYGDGCVSKGEDENEEG